MLIAMAGALWVALIASIAALIGAIVSPLTNWLVATASHRHDRQVRLRDRKTQAYLNLLRESRRQVAHREEGVAFIRALETGQTPGEFSEGLEWSLSRWLDEIAEVRAFTSKKVADAARAFEREAEVGDWEDIDIHDTEQRRAFLAKYEEMPSRMLDRFEELADAIRDELAR